MKHKRVKERFYWMCKNCKGRSNIGLLMGLSVGMKAICPYCDEQSFTVCREVIEEDVDSWENEGGSV